MSTFFQEFKKFAVKGNMIDLAVGVVIGAGFNQIVDVLVKRIITPPLGYITTGVGISDLEWVIKSPVMAADGSVADPGVILGYGLLIEALLDFMMVAFALFLIIRFVNSLKDRAEDETNKEVPTPRDIQLLADIRDEMRRFNTSNPPPKAEAKEV